MDAVELALERAAAWRAGLAVGFAVGALSIVLLVLFAFGARP